jgi:hypothetical protein
MVPAICGGGIRVTTLSLPLDQVTEAHLDSLVANGVAESRQLDYKQELPISSDEDKREFLGDVTSFANTIGGDIIYGVREARDAANKPTGVPEKIVGLGSVNLDQLKLTLDQLLRDAVDPRIPGLALHVIARGAEPPCLLVRAPRTPLGLHMVTFKGLGRFYGRGTSGRYVLDVAQIRDGFLGAEEAQERVRRFRLDRVVRVAAGDTPIPTGEGRKLIFHALPLTRLDVWPAFLRLAQTQSQIPGLLSLRGGTPSNWRYNLDGFVMHTTRSDIQLQAYTQLFRDGGIEAAGGVLHLAPDGGGFYGLAIEQATISVLKTAQRLWKLLGVTGPIVLGLSLSGIKGLRMLAGPYAVWQPVETFHKDLAIIPDVVLQDERAPAEQALKPLLDIAWNAGAWAHSPYFTETGEWKPPSR